MFKKREYIYIYSTRRVSIVTFIWYAHSRKIGKQNNVNVFGSKLTKGSEQDSHK
jgi:hypothetical protein